LVEKPNECVGNFDPPTFRNLLKTQNNGNPPLGTIEITRQFAVFERRDGAVFEVWPTPGQHRIEISLSGGACTDMPE
jgi:hypothetical protein